MDRKTRMDFTDLIGGIPKEKRGHRLRFIPNKTGLGFMLVCSCGWSKREYAGNRAGRDYAKIFGAQAFTKHYKEDSTMQQKIKYRRQKRVVLYLRGGDIQGASDVPPGFEVEVRDYDTDGTDQMVKRDEDGNTYLPLVIGGPLRKVTRRR